MILDQNDPTGLGLFSRCARNQACKATKSRPQTAGSRKQPKSELKVEQSKRKNTMNENWFGKQESREQRQRKFKRQITPAVGQYNPMLKDKPKLVWDVIKIYQKKTKEMKKLQQVKNKMNSKDSTLNPTSSLSPQKVKANQPPNDSIERSVEGDTLINTRFNGTMDQQTIINERSLSQSHQESNHRYHTSVSHKSACMVNMSRMTGRMTGFSGIGKNSLLLDQSTHLLNKTELNKSIEKIKPKTTKNFYFRKMLGRKQYERPVGTANMYECKIDLIKPRKTAQLNFGICRGRQESLKNDASVYSYSHYDYNEYVWKSTSSVFSNTKKHLISFDKQR